MTARRLLAHVLSAILAAFAAPAMAMPHSAESACGAQFQAWADQLATTAGGKLRPYHWLRAQLAGNTISVLLQVDTPAGPVLYSGFACTINVDGTFAGIGIAPPKPPAPPQR